LATIGLYQNLPISKIILLVVLIEAVILILPLVEALPFWIREYKSSTKGEFAERFNTAYEKALKQREKPLATMRFPLRVMVLILFSVIIASSIGVISGRVYATTRTTFLEMSFKSKQYVLIRSYPSERIYVPISKTNKLENGVLVQSTDTAMTDFRARGVTKLHR
ncbi:MAG TPA: hypothetical protein VG992_03705, partial [Candidatus Saccharimonadales bacterium]|nr:hypothetical protein [Candidatus Saccharimonadales bacterium]